ncbi:MAG TPA: hypothetical protein VJ953_08785 [Saprospiraceae bacterium]|nr:hypothetical protein [Saprospiraceae bacterium]
MDKAEIKHRLLRFFYLFGAGCLVMVLIRLLSSGQINPMGDQAASYGLVTGLLSLLVGYLFDRFF